MTRRDRARLDRLERHVGLPPLQWPPAQRPFFGHFPWFEVDGTTPIPPTRWPEQIRERPWCSGMFGYSGGTLPWSLGWWELQAALEPLDLYVSPKSLTGLGTWLDHWTADQRSRMTFAYHQEPEDDHPTPLTRAAFRAKVNEAAAIVRPKGVRNWPEMNGYVTFADVHGGAEAQLEMLPPEGVDGIGWSAFDPYCDGLAIDVVGAIVAFMREHFPGVAWGLSSFGIGIPHGTSAGDPVRARRADLAQQVIDAALAGGAEHLGYYDVSHFPTANYGVDAELLPVLQAASGR